MILGETIASLSGRAPSRSDALQVWERPVVDTHFPQGVALAIRRHAAYLDGIQAIQTSLQRLQHTHGAPTQEALLSSTPSELTRRLSAGLRNSRSRNSGVSRAAVEAYAAYEGVDEGVQVTENELAHVVEVNLGSLSHSVSNEAENLGPDVQAVLSMGQSLNEGYAREQRLLRELANRVPIDQRGQVTRYRKKLAMERSAPAELSRRHLLFSNDAIEQTLDEVWFANNGDESGSKAALKNFMHRVGVIRVWNIPHLLHNFNARLHGESDRLSQYRLVALPFMPVARLLSAREAVASANIVLTREYAGNEVDSYTVYSALQSKQNAFERAAQVLGEVKSYDEFRVQEQPVGRAYARHISRPLVKISKPVVEGFASLMAFFSLN